jgi:hypothetical protein
MSVRNATRLVAIAALAMAASRTLAAPDAAALIASLARTAPSSVAFAEARFSSLLREPLIVSGELAYGGRGSLDRRVTSPYRETTTVRGESVRVEREGEDPRTFGLQRAAELRGFISAFDALLSGDAASLEQAFAVAVSGDDAAWRLELTPTDGRARRRLHSVVIHGSGAEPHCFATLDTQGGGSVMFVGPRAAAADVIAPDASLDGLLAQCRAE